MAELKETHVLSTSLGEVGCSRSGEGDFEVRDELDPIVVMCPDLALEKLRELRPPGALTPALVEIVGEPGARPVEDLKFLWCHERSGSR